MKLKILKFSTLIFLLLFLGGSCQKDEIEFADESIIVSNRPPGLSIYKTRGDYLDKVLIRISDKGEIIATPAINVEDNPNFITDKNGKIKASYRRLLKNGYIVGGGWLDAAYTNITFDEYVTYNQKHNVVVWPVELLEPRIIDRDPYLEFYASVCHGNDCQVQEFTLGEIYEMLENGTIEEHFTRYK